MEWFWIVAGLGVVAFFFVTCACCASCELFNDLFNRANGTAIGADWAEEAGDWEISGNALRTSSSNAVAVLGTPITHDNYVITAKVKTLSASDPLRIMIREDANNYVLCEVQSHITSTSLTDRYLRIATVAAGVETEQVRVGLPHPYAPFDLEVCVYSEGQVQVRVFGNGNTPAQALAFITPAGQQIAVGTGASIGSMVELDQLLIRRRETGCTNCQKCCAPIWIDDINPVDTNPAEEMQVEVSGLSHTGTGCTSCSSLNGTYVLTFRGEGYTFARVVGDPGLVGCYYSLELDESVCSAKWAFLVQDRTPATRFDEYFAIGNAQTHPSGQTGLKLAIFRQTYTNNFCTTNEVDLPEFSGIANANKLCRQAGGESATATVTPL